MIGWSPSFSIAAKTEQSAQDILKHAARIDYLYRRPNNTLAYDEILALSETVIEHRHQYSKDSLAKVFVLLAELSSDKGDHRRALQFVNDGLSVTSSDSSINIRLNLMLVNGYYQLGQFEDVLITAKSLLALANQAQNIQHQLLALSYRAMAYGLLGDNPNALIDLQVVSNAVEEHQEYLEHVDLLEIFALANHFVEDYQASKQLHLKLLKLQHDTDHTHNIESTYYNLAQAYLELNELDDAFNAFWESKRYSERKSAPIFIARAELGMGQVLLKQQDFEAAFKALTKAEKLFKGQRLTQPYLSALIALAEAALYTERELYGYQLLVHAENIVTQVAIGHQHIRLYLLLANMYQQQGNYQNALTNLSTYIKLLESQEISTQERLQLKQSVKAVAETQHKLTAKIANSQELALQIEQRELKLKQIIAVQFFAILLGALTMAWVVLRYRALKLNLSYYEVEKPADYLPSPRQTQQHYFLEYKKARKYQYPITIGYISVVNWQELLFHFNKQVAAEVSKTIATIINEHIKDFDCPGRINDGEFIIMFPHQTPDMVEEQMATLTSALNERIFANLGGFSVMIRTVAEAPLAQDIDPFVFLSQLSELNNYSVNPVT